MMIAGQSARFMRLQFVGRSWTGSIAILAWIGSMATLYPCLQVTASEPVTLMDQARPEVHSVTIELDDEISDLTNLYQALSDAGFPYAQYIPYASGAIKRLSVPVSTLNSATLDVLRSIPGVKAVRKQYQIPGMQSPVILTDQVVAKAKNGVTDSQAAQAIANANCHLIRKMGIRVAMYVIRITDDINDDATSAAGRLNASGLFDFVEPDVFIEKSKHEIQDPLFPFQWHLQNYGQTDGLPGADVKAVPAWDVTEGQGATVAILDEAIDWQHPDLVDNVIAQYDFVHDDLDPSPTPPDQIYIDEMRCWLDPCQVLPPIFRQYLYLNSNCWSQDAHGTACAGLAAGRANNIGIRGVAPLANLIAIEMLNAPSSGSANAFYFAEANGAEVISNSWGPTIAGLPTDAATRTAIEDVALNGRGGRGCLVMFSSGNEHAPIHDWGTYAALDNVMAIGASMKDDRLSCYSNFGEEQSIVAPGGGGNLTIYDGPTKCNEPDMTTTDMRPFVAATPTSQPCFITETTLAGYNPPPPPGMGWPEDQTNLMDPDYSQRFNGTSAACPVAAGVAALVFSVAPGLTAEQARNILEHTADKVQVEGGAYDPVTGHNDRYGHGRVNAYRAVQAAQAGITWPSPIKDFSYDAVLGNAVMTWVIPSSDVVGILIVRSKGPMLFTPIDGRTYAVGEQIDANTTVLANDYLQSYNDENSLSGEYTYGVFTYNSDYYYSLGRKNVVQAKPVSNSPLASVTASPSAGNAPLKVLFSGGAIDPQNRSIVAYTWEFGDGSTGSGPSLEHTYTMPGQYLAKLTVRNSINLTGTATVLVKVFESQDGGTGLFTAGLVANPQSGGPSLPVTLNAKVITGTPTIARYEWDFGDGARTTTTSADTTHTYTAMGSYVASVKIIDVHGLSSTASASVTVTTQNSSQAARSTGLLPAGCGAGVMPMMAMMSAALFMAKFASRRYRR